MSTSPLWNDPVATGVGSLPGTEPLEACRLVFGELPDFPYLPELPNRGPWADLTGRASALLVEMPVDLQPAGWRLVDRASRDSRRAVAMLAQDLDALEEVADGYTGLLKLQVCGPFTLAATLERTRGDKVLADFGARRDLGQSLVEGVAAHVAEVARRVPGARVVLQVDEPAVPAVLAGAIPTVSGFSRLRAVPATEVTATIGALAAAVEAPVLVHCCATDAPFDVLAADGVAGLSFDLARLDLDADATFSSLAEAADGGLLLVVGAVPSLADSGPPVESTRRIEDIRSRVALMWQRFGRPAESVAAQVAISPSCGMASATPAHARAASSACVEVARRLGADAEVG